MGPRWPVLALLAAVALLGLAGCTAAWLRPRALAHRLTRCACGYPYADLPSSLCPECGRPHNQTARDTRAHGIFSALLLWTLSAIALAWSTALLLPLYLLPIQTLNCRYDAPSRAGTIHFEWMVTDFGRDPQVTGFTASSSRPGAPILTLSPADLADGGSRITAAMASLLAPAANTPQDDRDRITAVLAAAATTALTGGLPGPPHDTGGTILFGSGPAGTGYTGASTPRITAGAPLFFTIPAALLGGLLLAIRAAHARPAHEKGRASSDARPVDSKSEAT